MKKIIFLAAACLVLLFINSCVSVREYSNPHFYTHTSTEYEILGEVILESSERVGFVELLRAARNLYPDCDYVIDIMMDQKVTETIRTTFAIIGIYQTTETDIIWIMRGTAIKYIYPE